MPTTARNTPAQNKTSRTTATRRGSPSKKRSTANRQTSPDAVRLLKTDHEKVNALFERYEKTRSDQKEALAHEICQELKIHTQIEEEIFYPELRQAAKTSDDADDLLDEAKVEHNSAKQLIAEIESGSPDDDLFDAKVKVLGEYIRHHVKEEHRDIFPLARKRLDLKQIGERLAKRKAELMDSTTASGKPEGFRKH